MSSDSPVHGEERRLHAAILAAAMESEAHYRALVEVSPQVVWHADANGVITYFNPYWYAYTGLDPLHVGCAWTDAVHSEQRALAIRLWQHAIAQGVPFTLDILVAGVDQQYCWFEVRGTPVFDADSRLERWVGVAMDIDQRKRAENRQAFLLELSDRLQDTYLAEDVVSALGKSLGLTLQVDRIGYGRLDGQARINVESEWLMGQHPSALGLHELDDYLEPLEQTLGRNEVLVINDVLDDPYTTHHIQRHVLYSTRSLLLAPLFNQGQLSAVLFIASQYPRTWSREDVALVREVADRIRVAEQRTRAGNALREAEERFNLANSIAAIGVWEYDAASQSLVWDAQVKQLIGIPEQVPTPDRQTFLSMVHEADRELLVQTFKRSMDEGFNGQLSFDFRVYHCHDGDPRWITIRGRRLAASDGSLRVLGTARDISIERNAEENLRRSNAALQSRMAERNRVESLQAAMLMLGDLLRDQTESAAIIATSTRVLGMTLGVDRAGYATVDATGHHCTVSSDWTRSGTHSIIGTHRFSDYGSYVDSLRRGEVVVVDDTAHDERTKTCRAANEALGVGAMINLPLLEHGQLNALLILHSSRPRIWSEEEVSFVRDVADRTWSADERARAERAMRDSEEQFRTLADNMSQFAWTADPAGTIYWYNKRWYDYTGTSLEAMLALGWRSVHHPDHIDRVASRMKRCFATGSIWEDTFPLRGKDGKFSWFLSRALPIRDNLGRITHWLGTNTDITAQVSAEEALRELNESLELRVADRTRELASMNQLLQIEMSEREQAEEALRHAQKMDAIGQLTGGIAHDFNNMLTGVLGSLDLIQRRIAAGRVQEIDRYINAAITSANRAAALTHRLLAFARRQSLNPKAVDVNRLVASMEDLLSRTIGESIQLNIDVSETRWLANTDEHQLENALLNLVINARDAMPGGGRLRIETEFVGVAQAREYSLEPAEYVRLSVADSGCGMTPEIMARVFDPFFTTKPIGQGTGLGLSMVYGFIKQTGGHVRIHSEPEKGTEIALYLPRHQLEQEQADEVTATQAMPRAQSGETVLVIEDETAVRMLVVDVLRELGYTVLEAPDSRVALPLLQGEGRIDLLVSDVGLPGLNGRQVADIARHSRPELKVLFITGYARNAEVRSEFLEDGMEMLTKPFNIDVLALKIREMIEAPPG